MLRRWWKWLALIEIVVCCVVVALFAYVATTPGYTYQVFGTYIGPIPTPTCPTAKRTMAPPYLNARDIQVKYAPAEWGTTKRITTYNTNATKDEVEAYYDRTMTANNWQTRQGDMPGALYYYFENLGWEGACVKGGRGTGYVNIVVTSGNLTQVQVIERGNSIVQPTLTK
jgi:hypothetical protein